MKTLKIVVILTFSAMISAAATADQVAPTVPATAQTKPIAPSAPASQSAAAPTAPTSQKPAEPAKPAAPPLPTVCAGTLTSGVDVSDHQLSTDWQETHKAGWRFAFVKATQGIDFVNVSFDVDWKNAKDAGITRGAYHFFMPSDDPATQAKFFLDTVGTMDANDLAPMFDWEYPSTEKAATIIANAKIWLQTVEAATGKTPIIYTYPAYWKNLGSPAGFEKYPLFIADDTGNCPEVPAPWKTWAFWQHGLGAVQGVVERTDLDFFNGSM